MDPSQLALIKQLIAEAEAKKEGKDTQPIDKTSAPPTPGPAAAAAAVATHCHSKPAETAKDMQGSKGVPQNGDGEDPVKLKQFWSKFKVGAQPSQTPVPEQSRQPSSTPEPDQIAKLSEAPVPEQPAPEQITAPEQTPMLDTKTEIWHTLMDHEGWKQKLKDHVGTRWDFKSFFLVCFYNHNTIFRFTGPEADIDGEPTKSDFPLIVCTGQPPREPFALSRPDLIAPDLTLLTPPATPDSGDDPMGQEKASREHAQAIVAKLNAEKYRDLMRQSLSDPLFPQFLEKTGHNIAEPNGMVEWMVWQDAKLKEEDTLMRQPTLRLGEAEPETPATKPVQDAATQPSQPPPAGPPSTAAAEPNTAAATPAPVSHTPPSVPTATVASVESALMRATTVDLERAAKQSQICKTEKGSTDNLEPPPDAAPSKRSPSPNAEAEPTSRAENAKEAAQRRVRAIKGRWHRSMKSTLHEVCVCVCDLCSCHRKKK